MGLAYLLLGGISVFLASAIFFLSEVTRMGFPPGTRVPAGARRNRVCGRRAAVPACSAKRPPVVMRCRPWGVWCDRVLAAAERR